jgi:hypothetical protein
MDAGGGLELLCVMCMNPPAAAGFCQGVGLVQNVQRSLTTVGNCIKAWALPEHWTDSRWAGEGGCLGFQLCSCAAGGRSDIGCVHCPINCRIISTVGVFDHQ